MGYESKIIVARKYPFESPTNKGYSASEIIAILDMCNMGQSHDATEFLNLFDTNADFALLLPEGDNEQMKYVTEDRYGDHITYIKNLDKGIELAEKLAENDSYWRFKLLINFLKMFKDCSEEVYICHFGY